MMGVFPRLHGAVGRLGTYPDAVGGGIQKPEGGGEGDMQTF